MSLSHLLHHLECQITILNKLWQFDLLLIMMLLLIHFLKREIFRCAPILAKFTYSCMKMFVETIPNIWFWKWYCGECVFVLNATHILNNGYVSDLKPLKGKLAEIGFWIHWMWRDYTIVWSVDSRVWVFHGFYSISMHGSLKPRALVIYGCSIKYNLPNSTLNAIKSFLEHQSDLQITL